MSLFRLALVGVAAMGVIASACVEDEASMVGGTRVAVVVGSPFGGETAKPEVDFGQPFPLRVERSWRRGMRPSACDLRALSPLVLEPTESSRIERGGCVIETRLFRAQVFAHESVTIGPLRLIAVPENGGAPEEATSEPLTVRVRSSLAGVDDLAVEQPMDLARPQVADGWEVPVALAAFAVLALVAFALQSRSRRSESAPLPATNLEPARDLRADAFAAFVDLESRPSSDGEFAERLALAVRGYARLRLRLRADTLTTEEIAGSLRQQEHVKAAERAAAALLPCDLVKFARMSLGAEQRLRAIAAAREFVEAAS